MSTASNDNKAKLTNRDLWRVFLHQLTIRGANNYERQQNAGFTEAMMKHIQGIWSISSPMTLPAPYQWG